MPDNEKREASIVLLIYYLLHFTFGLIALYFSFQRNKGFELGSFLAAIFMPYIYVPYALAVPMK